MDKVILVDYRSRDDTVRITEKLGNFERSQP